MNYVKEHPIVRATMLLAVVIRLREKENPTKEEVRDAFLWAASIADHMTSIIEEAM